MSVRHLSNRDSDGCMVGQNSTDKVGFYGVTPVAQPVLATGATTTQIVAALALLGLTRLT
jgi:hypothetical protein